MTDVLACVPLSPVSMGLSRRENQPETLLSMLRLTDMLARVVMVTPRESCIEVDIEKASVACFRDVEVVLPRSAAESGKEENDHAPEVSFPLAHGHLTGTSLRGNLGFFSVVKICLKKARTCVLLSLALRNIKVQRSDGRAQYVAEEVLIAVLVKHQLAS
jgi:hypothetical protein